MTGCAHQASGRATLDATAGRLRCAVVCDRCGTELFGVHEMDYRPEPVDLAAERRR